MATRANPVDILDLHRKLERQVHALATSERDPNAPVYPEPDDNWFVPTLQGGWVNVGGFWPPARYRRLRSGQIEIQGVIMNGTLGSAAFILPDGYRPDFVLAFAQIAGGFAASGALHIGFNGSVAPTWGDATWFALNCTFTPVPSV